MTDNGSDTFLMVLFAMTGIAILVMAWVQPMSLSERIGITFMGSLGPFWMLSRVVPYISRLGNGGLRKRKLVVGVHKKSH